MKSKISAILLVDDDDSDLQFITRAFRKLGVANPIHSVRSGNEAIRYLNGEGQFADRKAFPYPTFILTDLKMHDGDGFTLLHNLKTHPAWAVIPTILISGSADTDDVKKAFMLGASAYFVKPSDLAELEDLVRVTYEFWNKSETPEVDAQGQQLKTQSQGKLGQPYQQLERVDKKRGT